LRVGISERPLEAHQFGPVDCEAIRVHALARKGARGINGGCGGDKHFFRIAPAQRARSAEWLLVDHCDRPTGGATTRRDRSSGRA
jgi:hypothetical protein